jgi:hypothetical protein
MGQRNVKILFDAGVNVAFGTDSGALPTKIQGFAEQGATITPSGWSEPGGSLLSGVSSDVSRASCRYLHEPTTTTRRSSVG